MLGVLPDIKAVCVRPKPIRVYKMPGGREVLKEFTIKTETDPAPSIPYVSKAICYYLVVDQTEFGASVA